MTATTSVSATITTTATPSATATHSQEILLSATKNTENTSMPQNTIVGISVGAALAGAAVIYFTVRHIRNVRLAKLNELNSGKKPTQLTLRVLVTENPVQGKIRKNSLTNSPLPDEYGEEIL
jgi:hypothetical protein